MYVHEYGFSRDLRPKRTTNYLSFKLLVFLKLLPKSGCLKQFSHTCRFVLPVHKMHFQLEYRAQRSNPKSLTGG